MLVRRKMVLDNLTSEIDLAIKKIKQLSNRTSLYTLLKNYLY